MTVRLTSLEHHRLAVFVASGDVTAAAIADAHARMSAIRDGVQADARMLAWIPPGARITATGNDLREFGLRLPLSIANGRRVFVAENDLAFGVMRMLTSLRAQEPEDTFVVRSIDHAAGLLDVSVDEVQSCARRPAGAADPSASEGCVVRLGDGTFRVDLPGRAHDGR